jgi:hypothetical protein
MSQNELLEIIAYSPGIISHIAAKEFIAAIKLLRGFAGCGLREAKEAVDAWRAGKRPPMRSFPTLMPFTVALLQNIAERDEMSGGNLRLTGLERQAIIDAANMLKSLGQLADE